MAFYKAQIVNFVAYKAEHLAALDLQAGQARIGPYLAHDYAQALESAQHMHTFTGIHDGRVIVIAGLIDTHPGTAVAWVLLGKGAGKHFLAIHRGAKRCLDHFQSHGRLRIELDADLDVSAEYDTIPRWAKMLGFELEAPRMRKFRPDGGDCAKYARIR